MMPVAVERSSAEIWETRPSPTVRMVNVCSACIRSICIWIMPTAKPPRMLTTTMIIAAIASPLTNLVAPSMAP